jgi:hypothetical protein
MFLTWMLSVKILMLLNVKLTGKMIINKKGRNDWLYDAIYVGYITNNYEIMIIWGFIL